MSLRDAPLLYVFYETAALAHQRELCEDILGLQVIENQFHPPHEYHGLVKYDGGQIILSLNLAKEPRFQKGASDGLITVLAVDSTEVVLDRLRRCGYQLSSNPGAVFTDAYGHHYIFRSVTPGSHRTNGWVCPAVQELRLIVTDFAASMVFYKDILGLTLLEQTEDTARFATGSVDLLIQYGETAPDGHPVHYHTYLPVFYTSNIAKCHEALVQRGLIFKSHRIGASDIGYTMRFTDPSGHIYCLYEPSEESLTWGSGAKVKEIVANIENYSARNVGNS